MEKIIVNSISLLLLSASIFSCVRNRATNETNSLCPRNVYSRNGVDSVMTYSFSTKEGQIDRNSKTLYSIERFDSLGNLIYYKGKDYPSVFDDAISDCHYQIIRVLDIGYDAISVYKIEYSDTVMMNAAYFNTDGKYVARIEHKKKDNQVTDSVFVYGRLCYVSLRYLDTQGRDSLRYEYDDEYSSKLELASQSNRTYEQLNDSTIRDYRKMKHREFQFRKNHKYYESSFYIDNRDSHYEYDERGLLQREFEYQDKTICKGYSEYEYTYHTYPNIMSKK